MKNGARSTLGEKETTKRTQAQTQHKHQTTQHIFLLPATHCLLSVLLFLNVPHAYRSRSEFSYAPRAKGSAVLADSLCYFDMEFASRDKSPTAHRVHTIASTSTTQRSTTAQPMTSQHSSATRGQPWTRVCEAHKHTSPHRPPNTKHSANPYVVALRNAWGRHVGNPQCREIRYTKI